ncbi:hypothetical protein HGRIS_006424 [Hohenbuehelia grisea]|uniref:tRNA (adenine(58)-N(1))-methyltransferase catalytic subunit TRM61 n=1 Tax=Hohenbuehelia grisea TaxID=104357 RepID=A0ABR3K056_9AGAR
MWSDARTIQHGDVLIVWLTRDLLQPIQVTKGADLNIRFGYYLHDDLIGVPYGSKVASRNKKGFIHVLRPTPELWTQALPHRTQILYLADIAFVTSHLDIRPGSRVVEAGTGSGSFSHSVARTVGPKGHLFSFEFHHTRFLKATDEFTRHGLMPGTVTLAHRNVCKDGFDPSLNDSVDSVFLDLPMPWDAVPYAKAALRKDRISRICCFSPCMEQVLRTVIALNDAGFSEITMYETLTRPHEVSIAPPPLKTVQSAATTLMQAERVREDRRLRQVASSTRAGLSKKQDKTGKSKDVATGEEEDASEGAKPHGEKRKRGVSPDAGAVPASNASPAPEPPKKARLDTDGDDPSAPTQTLIVPSAPDATPVPGALTSTPGRNSPSVAPIARTSVSRAFAEVRGHTSYLTFACLLPPVAAAKTSLASTSLDRSESTPKAPEGVDAEVAA